jgi:hypothetical protein
MKHLLRYISIAGLASLSGFAPAQESVQSQIDTIKSVLPKFAIPMREVGDRFQNMYFAAKGGNWALAAYMSKYMDKSMNPASYTKAEEYQSWRYFYDTTFDPVNKAIKAQDFKAFEKEYMSTIASCNACHASMGYGFIKVVKLRKPANNGVDYKVPSKPGDVPP